MIIEREYLTMSDIGLDTAGLAEVLEGAYNDITDISTPPTECRALAAYLIAKYSGNWVVWRDTIYDGAAAPYVEDNSAQIAQFKSKLGFIFTATFDRYHRLISLYKDNESKLLNQLSSSTQTKFNNTPQGGANGDYTDDPHMSTYSRTESAADPGDLMSRITNIQFNYINLWRDWVNEFTELFGEIAR